MLHTQGASRDICNLLVLDCCSGSSKRRERFSQDGKFYPFPKQVSSAYLEVQSLTNPTKDEFVQALEKSRPSLVCFEGDYLESDEVGSVMLDGNDYADPEAICGIFAATVPTAVYLEIPNGEEAAEALHSKGIPYVIYWKGLVSPFAASHFHRSFLSVLTSSCAHVWDAFQLARASHKVYCRQKVIISDISDDNLSGVYLLGTSPEIDVFTPEVEAEEEENEGGSLSTIPTIKIHDDEVDLRFLVCGVPCTLDPQLLSSLEDGLNALLTTEIRGSKLIGKFSVIQLLVQTESFSRDVVTMRCDVSTCSSAHVSFLLSGNAQICFNDQLLENHIKKEIVEQSRLVHGPPCGCGDETTKAPPISDPRLSASIASGAKVFEVSFKLPTWASQILRQLALDASHHSLVALGIASIQGLAVASFDKDDKKRLLFFCLNEKKHSDSMGLSSIGSSSPAWLRPPAPSRKRPGEECETTTSSPSSSPPHLFVNETSLNDNKDVEELKEDWKEEKKHHLLPPPKKRLKVAAALRPVPRIHPPKMLQLFPPRAYDRGVGHYDGGTVPHPAQRQRVIRPASLAYRRSSTKSFQSRQQLVSSLNPLPLKRHGCDRSSIQLCTEEEFLKDVMHFLTIRGHSRLIPQSGLCDFPDSILNAKRLDVFNLYKEVVSRGGFNVGNGINWKGQVFSKMSNYTTTHHMTGVGNTLKRHYETYLLEYELAHDDVDGECCLICHGGAAGDWVNCGTCGEWAHFGCDRRQGLGAFKDYAKTDGLGYICPQCSNINSNSKKKRQRISNGFSKAPAAAY